VTSGAAKTTVAKTTAAVPQRNWRDDGSTTSSVDVARLATSGDRDGGGRTASRTSEAQLNRTESIDEGSSVRRRRTLDRAAWRQAAPPPTDAKTKSAAATKQGGGGGGILARGQRLLKQLNLKHQDGK